LFHSPAFWFGVLGLVGLLWGWWMSMGHHSWVEVGSSRDWELGQTWGRVYAFWYVEGWPNWEGFYAEHCEVEAENLTEMESELAAGRKTDSSFRYLIISYRLLISAYVMLWSALLWWRKRLHDKAADLA
jgi:hypothetical protein